MIVVLFTFSQIFIAESEDFENNAVKFDLKLSAASLHFSMVVV